MNYETWMLQRNDLRHAKSIAEARPAVSTRQASHMARKPDRKKIEQERMHVAAIDAENARLYGRLKRIHGRANDGWNKSHLFERLAPQFHKQHAMVRSLKMKNVQHRWSHDKRRLRGVTSFVKFQDHADLSLVPRRPDGIGEARKHRQRHRAGRGRGNSFSSTQSSPRSQAGGGGAASRDPFALTGEEATVLVHRRAIDPAIWKLEYREGTKLDMASGTPGKGPAGRSSFCIVSCWSTRTRPAASKSPRAYRLLVTVEDVRSSSKKMLLLRSEHLRYLMDDTAGSNNNGSNSKTGKDDSSAGPRRRLDSRGWDHAVQIPHAAGESFDALNAHLDALGSPRKTRRCPWHPDARHMTSAARAHWFRIIVGSLYFSCDLALSIAHPTDRSCLSRYAQNASRLRSVVALVEQHRTDVRAARVAQLEAKKIGVATSSSLKDPRDTIDDNCTFSPRLNRRTHHFKGLPEAQKAANALANSRRIVARDCAAHGHVIPLVSDDHDLHTDQPKRQKRHKKIKPDRNNAACHYRKEHARHTQRQIRMLDNLKHEAGDSSLFPLSARASQTPEDYEDLHEGASKIQAHFRRRRATQRAQDLRDQKISATKLQAIQRGRKQRQEKREREAAAARLQARFRGNKDRVVMQDVTERRYAEWRRTDALQTLFRSKDRDCSGFLGVKDLGRMLKDIPAKAAAAANRTGGGSVRSGTGGSRQAPKSKDLKKLVRAMNLTSSDNEGGGRNGMADGVSEVGCLFACFCSVQNFVITLLLFDTISQPSPHRPTPHAHMSQATFISYMLQGLKMTRKEILAFRRKGNIQNLLADLIEFVAVQVNRRIVTERNAALNAVFNHFDDDNSGVIDAAEFRQLIAHFSGKGKDFCPTADEITDLMNSLDKDGNGELAREEFIAFCMGGLAQPAAQRREYAKQSAMHNKLAVLLDRISLGIDRRTKALHTYFEETVEGDPTRRISLAHVTSSVRKSGAARAHVLAEEKEKEEEEEVAENNDGDQEKKSIEQGERRVRDEQKSPERVEEERKRKEKMIAVGASGKFIQAITGSRAGSLAKNDFVLFMLSGGSDPLVLKAQHPVIARWRTMQLAKTPW